MAKGSREEFWGKEREDVDNYLSIQLGLDYGRIYCKLAEIWCDMNSKQATQTILSDTVRSKWRESEIKKYLIVHCLQDVSERRKISISHTFLNWTHKSDLAFLQRFQPLSLFFSRELGLLNFLCPQNSA